MIPTKLRTLLLPALCLLAFFYIRPVMAQNTLELIQQRGSLIVGVKTDYPPWGMIDQAGSIVGFEPDIARKLADKLGVKLVLKSVSTANRFQTLNKARVDMLIATVGDTLSRQSLVAMVRPHYYRSGVTAMSLKTHQFTEWSMLIDQPVCLSSGAYFNKTIVENYRVKPVILLTARDAQLALMTGKCVAWAYDSGLLHHLSRNPAWHEYDVSLPLILPIEWSLVTRKGSAASSLNDFLEQQVIKWVRDGTLQRLAELWQLPERDYLAAKTLTWNKHRHDGELFCQASQGSYPAQCLSPGLDVTVTREQGWWPFDTFDTHRLIGAFIHSFVFTSTAIVLTLVIAVLLTLLSTTRWQIINKTMLLLVTVQSSVPPIVLLYLLYFGAISYLPVLTGWEQTLLSGVNTALLVLALYTAAGISMLLRARMTAGECQDGAIDNPLFQAFIDCKQGVQANLINLVKAAGIASVIAAPNAILIINSLVAEQGFDFIMMTLLMLFYYGEVLFFIYFIDRFFTYAGRRLSPSQLKAGE